MKSLLLYPLALALLAGPALAQDQPALTNTTQKISYALGMDIYSTLQKQEFELDLKALAAGMTDAAAGKPALTPDQVREAMMLLNEEVSRKADAKQKVAAEKNLQEGQAFLAANAKKEGVKTKAVSAPDGSKAEIQYQVLKSGTGPSPKATDTVRVHYHGTLTDGTVFDSSVERNEPVSFALNMVIPGWTEAVQMMKVGDKWRVFIPPTLAYGEMAPPAIGPNRTLIFEIELLGIEKPEAPEPAAAATKAAPATPK